jgi:hypothetical protein
MTDFTPLYNVVFKGGPLHDQVKPYRFERPDMFLDFLDIEFVSPFNVAGGAYAVSSQASMRHYYHPSRVRDENNNVVYFYEGTKIENRSVSQESPKAASQREESVSGPERDVESEVVSGSDS